jgi:plastocyanin
MSKLKLMAVAAMALALAGCGGPAAPPKPSGPPYDKAAHTGKITGVVKFDGVAPERKLVDLAGDKSCAAYHTVPPLSESLIVNDGRLQNVIVYIKKGYEKWSYPTPATSVLMDQAGCRYAPHVISVQSGQTVVFRNSDDISHNVHAVSPVSRNFNLPQYKLGAKDEVKFDIPEVAVRVQCDIHKWMSGFIGVFDHPFHAVTNEKGEFSIDGVPPGEYELEAWHEPFDGGKLDGPQALKVVVKDKETATADFTFAMKK